MLVSAPDHSHAPKLTQNRLGLEPTLLISVPATGVYYGARDITKNMLKGAGMGDTSLIIFAAFVADVVSLMFRTPADTLAMRLQAATVTVQDDDEVAESISDALVEAQIDTKVGNWLLESLQRLPAAIATDLPYLLSRIFLNSILIPGPIDVGTYELTTLATACICAFATTPFDVARTRILVNNDKSRRYVGLAETLEDIVNEGGFRSLFSGWLERTTYLGISSLWLPFALVFYIAIRDSILLEWFD